jgi:hypothetical protein
MTRSNLDRAREMLGCDCDTIQRLPPHACHHLATRMEELERDHVAYLRTRAKARYLETGTDAYGRRALEAAADDLERYGLPDEKDHNST